MNTTQTAARTWGPVVAGAVVLIAVAFLQRPGWLYTDTKLDLIVNPQGFLQRAGYMWDGSFFGQLQNQAFGYFVPIGGFFWLGQLLGVPPWITLAAWHATVLVTAYLGVVLLLRAIGGVGATAAVMAGLLYATSPRMVTFIGTVSSEILPMAAAPWLLLPLVHGSRRARPLLFGLWAGLAVLIAGGVNASATLAVLVLPGLWFATRRWTWHTVRLGVGWVIGLIAGTTWWMGPLMLLGRYSPPFLDWIESSAVTTSATTPLNVLRGTSQWAAFIVDAQGPVWPPGHFLATDAYAVGASLLIAAVALVSLAIAVPRERAFLTLAALVGFTCVSVGHAHSLGGPVPVALQQLLDGPLAPFRNIHKFEPVLRLPLMISLAYGATAALRHLATDRIRGFRKVLFWALHRSAVAGTVAAVAISSLIITVPLLSGNAVARGAYLGVGQAWRDASSYLHTHGSGSALIVPSSPFGTYTWGSPRDEPMQPIARTPWAVRDVVPLSSAGNIRLLDEIESILAAGRPHAGLATMLTRAGVNHIVLRNDLAWFTGTSVRPELPRQVLAGSPGLQLVAAYGDPLSLAQDLTGPGDAAVTARQVEIFEVRASGHTVEVQSVDAAATTMTGPEVTGRLAENGLLANRLLTTGGQQPPTGRAPLRIITDDNRRREHEFASATNAYGPTLAADEPYVAPRAVHDYLTTNDTNEFRTTAQLDGARTVTASSSAAHASGLGVRNLAAQPSAAIDGVPSTSWQSSPYLLDQRPWWEVTWEHPTVLTTLQIQFEQRTPTAVLPRAATVTADGVNLGRFELMAGSTALTLPWLDTSAKRLRLQFEYGDRDHFSTIAVSDIRGLPPVRRYLVPPAVKSASPQGPGTQALSFRADVGNPVGCVMLLNVPRCGPGLQRGGEEETGLFRKFTLDSPLTGPADIAAVVKPGPELVTAVYPNAQAVSGSSSSGHPWSSPHAAFDGRRDTQWAPLPHDRKPTLTMRFDTPQNLTAIQVLARVPFADRLNRAAAQDFYPTAVRVSTDTTSAVLVGLDDQGRAPVTLPTARRVDIEFVSGRIGGFEQLSAADHAAALRVAEVYAYAGGRVVQPVMSARQQLELPCGQGPEVRVNGAARSTTVRAEVASALSGSAFGVELCGGSTMEVPAGDVTVDIAARGAVAPLRFDVIPAQVSKPAPASAATRQSLSPTQFAVSVADSAHQRVLRVPQNYNTGWVARAGGQTLQPIVLDGWQQGYVMPAGVAGAVQLEYAPQQWYQRLLFGGLGLAAMTLCGAVFATLWRPRRLSADDASAERARRQTLATMRPVIGWVIPVVAGGVIASAPGALVGLACVLLGHLFIARRTRQVPDSASGTAESSLRDATATGLLDTVAAPAGSQPQRNPWVWNRGDIAICLAVTVLTVAAGSAYLLQQIAQPMLKTGLAQGSWLCVAGVWLVVLLAGYRCSISSRPVRATRHPSPTVLDGGPFNGKVQHRRRRDRRSAGAD